MTDHDPTTDDDSTDTQTNPYEIGDPVMDAAQGRAMVVLGAPEQNVAEWSNDNGYDLLENYANGKFDPEPDEYVVECVYVSDVRSEPSKTYTFPVSRVRLIDAHHADDGLRVAERVAVEVLAAVFDSMLRYEPLDSDDVAAVAKHTGDVSAEVVSQAMELAEVEQQFREGADE